MTDLIKSTQALKTAFDKHYERVTDTKPSWRTEAAERIDRLCAHDASTVGGIYPLPYSNWKKANPKKGK